MCVACEGAHLYYSLGKISAAEPSHFLVRPPPKFSPNSHKWVCSQGRCFRPVGDRLSFFAPFGWKLSSIEHSFHSSQSICCYTSRLQYICCFSLKYRDQMRKELLHQNVKTIKYSQLMGARRKYLIPVFCCCYCCSNLKPLKWLIKFK